MDMATLCVAVLASEEGAMHPCSSCPRNMEQPDWLKFTQFSCTVPTQPKTGILSAIKTIGYKSFITPKDDLQGECGCRVPEVSLLKPGKPHHQIMRSII